mgnify:CR=1 FL=1
MYLVIIFIILYIYNFNKKKKIYLTMTTLPNRIVSSHFKNVINSLLIQSKYYDKIILNIPYKYKRTNEKYIIPKWIKNNKKIKIIRCEDNGPATKILGLINNVEENSILIIVDDDIIYDKNIVKNLIKNYNGNNIVTHELINRKYFKEPMGFASYLVPYKFIKNINNIKIPKDCFYIDDTFFGWYYSTLNINITKINTTYWDRKKTDKHPKWFELNKDTNRDTITTKCISKLIL